MVSTHPPRSIKTLIAFLEKHPYVESSWCGTKPELLYFKGYEDGMITWEDQSGDRFCIPLGMDDGEEIGVHFDMYDFTLTRGKENIVYSYRIKNAKKKY